VSAIKVASEDGLSAQTTMLCGLPFLVVIEQLDCVVGHFHSVTIGFFPLNLEVATLWFDCRLGRVNTSWGRQLLES